jgi:hypothetical protein
MPCLLVLTFVCNRLGLLFANCTTMFVTLKMRKWFWSFKYLFQDATNVVTLLTMDKNKTSNFTRIWHYVSIYFSNLDCLSCLNFLWMLSLLIVDCFFSKFFKKSMLFVFTTWWPPYWSFIYNCLNKCFLPVKILMWSM